MSSTKIMYFGAGLHLDPLDHFPSASEFIFVDTLPRSEFDRKNKFREYYYCHEFVNDLIAKCQAKGFMLLMEDVLDGKYFTKIMSWYQRWIWLNKVKQTFPYICPTRLTFFNNSTNQTLKYYVSTNIEHNMPNSSLTFDLATCDGWIVSGFHPPKFLLYSIWTPLIFYGYSRTVFKIARDEEEEEETLIQWIYNETEKRKSISFILRYFACNIVNGELEECDNIIDLNLKTVKMRMLLNA